MNLSYRFQDTLERLCDRLLQLAEAQGLTLEGVANGELHFRRTGAAGGFLTVQLVQIASAPQPEVWELTPGAGAPQEQQILQSLLVQMVGPAGYPSGPSDLARRMG